ncbi:MAG: HlyD family efflux transporter periplasmic adaptor subunit [Pseudomonadota bacterium]
MRDSDDATMTERTSRRGANPSVQAAAGLFRLEALRERDRRECAAFDRSPLASFWLVVAICVLLVGSLGVIARLPIARKATVPGRIELQDAGVQLFADGRRTLDALLVDVGDRVQPGTRLAVLASARRAATQKPGALARSLRAQQRALDATREHEVALAQARATAFALEADANLARRRALNVRRTQAAEALRLARAREDRAQALFNQGHAPAALREEATLSRLDYESTLTALEEEQQRLAVSERRIDTDIEAAESELARSLARLQFERERLSAEATRVRREEQQILFSPIDGVVSGVLAQVGATLERDRPVLTLLPEAHHYSAKLWVPAGTAGAVTEGQPVRLLIDAFPHQRFGSIFGRISHVNRSPLPVPAEQLAWNATGPAYEVAITMDTKHRLAVALKPGMTLRADISLEQRSLFELLFESLLSAIDRAAA